MSWTVWAAFVAASFVIAIIPGPGVGTIVGYALNGGRRIAFAAVAGAAAGNFLASALSLAGAGLLLAQSAMAFTILKWLGAAYLIGLGLYAMTLLPEPSAGAAASPAIPARTAFWGTSLVTSLHPKTILFFMSFTPQFIAVDRPYWPQAALLAVTFTIVLAASDATYALFASAASGVLKGRRLRLWSQRAGGGVLVAAGLATAATTKS